MIITVTKYRILFKHILTDLNNGNLKYKDKHKYDSDWVD